MERQNNENRPAFHGSDLELVEAWYHIPREGIVCYSDNINPLGISPKLRASIAKKCDVVTRYPERNYETLRTAVSRYCGSEFEYTLVGSGATNLISRFIREVSPKKAVLISPSYSEYEREVGLVGGELILYPLKEENGFKPVLSELKEMLEDSVDLLIFCNPNNPTGYAMHHKELRELFEHCKAHEIYCMVDETYVEFAPDIADITAIPLTKEYEKIYVMRGISKFFAAPGLRFGYAVTSDEALIGRINKAKDPWSINSIAEACVPDMLGDTAYIEETSHFINEERMRLCALLEKEPNVKVYPSEANFILLRIDKEGLTSADLFDAMIRDHMMIRDCSSFDGLGDDHIRFNIRLKEENDRLLKKLLEIVHEKA